MNVTDSAWEKMAADPEYKQKMMDLCERDLCDPAWGVNGPMPAVCSIRIDADCDEEYLAYSGGSADGRKRAGEGGEDFWKKRSQKGKDARKNLEKLALERREMMAFLQKRVDARREMGGMAGVFAAVE